MRNWIDLFENEIVRAINDTERTDRLRKWFTGSKVVDEKGDPLVCYHGTDANFSVFDKRDLGYHFGTKNAAQDRLTHRGVSGGIMEVYLRITNPLHMYDHPDWTPEWLFDSIDPSSATCREPFLTQEEYEAFCDQHIENPTVDDFRNLYIAHGYDGITYENAEEDAGSTSWIAFYPNQIKSVHAREFGTSNDVFESVSKPTLDFNASEDAWEFHGFDVHALLLGDPAETLGVTEISSMTMGQGNAERALRWLRTQTPRLGAYDPGQPGDASYAFWERMVEKGLVDWMVDEDGDLIYERP